MIDRRTVLSALGVLAVSGMLLTGCSAGTQSKADACKLIQSDASSAATTLEAAFTKIQDDPAAAEKALKNFDTKWTSAVAKVTNPTVRAAGDASVKSLNALDADLKKYVADPTDSDVVDSLQSNADKVQTAFNKLGTVCSAA
ncbi:MAG TPA: hypothetical protein VGM70_10190 [Pseudolysinimonas sp.]|jgi:hypothetical protein